MPQVDLETIFCGGDGKVACETMISGEDPVAETPSRLPEEDPDMPAESFQVQIGEEIDWIDVNAVYERDDSTKGNTNPKSHHTNSKQQLQPPSNSQRFSGNLKHKAPIIALPNKIQHSGYLGRSGRLPPISQIFPKKKRAGAGRKSAVPPPEPGSPKVSCFGKVLSDRERTLHRRRKKIPAAEKVEEVERRRGRSGGCCARLSAIFRCGRPARRNNDEDGEEKKTPTMEDKTVKWSGRLLSAVKAEEAAAVQPEGIGTMRRFSSARRPASWGGDEDDDNEGHVAWSAPLDR